MPLTAKGESLLEKFKEQYGEEEGTRIFYASKNAGKITGVDAHPRRRRRKVQQRDPFGREAGTYEEEDSGQLRLPLVTVVGDAESKITSMCMAYDTIEFDDKGDYAPKPTSDGNLKAMPRIARTGIQLYKGDECGRPDLDVVRVYRPASSVFARDAMKSYTGLPITIDHPGGPVDPSNWKNHSVGETGEDTVRDGEMVRVPMMLRDAEAIKLVQEGKRELSVGYGCDLRWGAGVTPDGQAYDATQYNIRGNHLAIVSHARGGPSLRIGDTTMSDLKIVLVDGLPCQMSEKDAAIVQRTITQLQDQLEDQIENFKKKLKEKEEKEDAAAKEIAKRDEDMKTKDALILTLQTQLKDATDPAKLDIQLADRDAVRAKARVVMSNAFKVDGKKIEDIRREVVIAKSGVPSAKDWGDAEIKAVFEHLTAGVQPLPINPIDHARRAFDSGGAQDPKLVAYNEMVKDMENAWKTPAK
jgi:uncharacterized protein